MALECSIAASIWLRRSYKSAETHKKTRKTQENTDAFHLKLTRFPMIYNEFWPLPSGGAPEYPEAFVICQLLTLPYFNNTILMDLLYSGVTRRAM